MSKKQIGMLMMVLLPVLSAAAVTIDDFERYVPGNVSAVASPPWVVYGTTEASVIGQEASGNKYIETARSYISLGENAIPNADTATTVFFRIQRISGSDPDWAIGLSDIAAPTGDWGNYECYVAIVGSNLLARNSGSNTTILSGLTSGIWYNIWMVINNSTNRYDVYVTTEVRDATEADRRASNFAFRKSTANDLVTFKIYGRDSSTSVRRQRADDIYIMPGANLSWPTVPRAKDPSPDGSALVDPGLTTQVSWTKSTDPAADHQLLYWVETTPGTAPDFSGATPVNVGLAESWTITPPLGYDMAYYWCVDTYVSDSNVPILGTTWSFQTISMLPVVTREPVDAIVYEDDAFALFTAEFSTPFNLPVSNVAWYKVGTPDVQLSPGAKYTITVGSGSTQLKVNNPTRADEGYYYCVVSNAQGSAAPTAPAVLYIPSYWFWVYEGFGDAQNNVTLNGYTGLSASYGLAPDPNTWVVQGGTINTLSSTTHSQIGVKDGYVPDTVDGRQHWARKTGWSVGNSTHKMRYPIDLSVNGEFYISFWTAGDSNDHVAQVGLSNATYELLAGNAYSGNRGLTAYYGTNGTHVETNVGGVTVTSSTNSFYLVKFVKSSSGFSDTCEVTIQWWNLGTVANPNNDIRRAPDRTRTVNLTGVTGVFDMLKFKVDGWVSIDEIRVGPTEASVTGIPPVASDPWVEEVTDTNVVLHWKAAMNPTTADPNFVVDPGLVNQYVFMTGGDPLAEPNFLYLGATGTPSISDPNSRFPAVGTLMVQYNSVYQWVVVSVYEEQNLIPGVSTLNDVDPNNLVGDIWTYQSILTIPWITLNPADVVRHESDPNALLHGEYVDLAPPVGGTVIKWYKYQFDKPDIELTESAKYSILRPDPNTAQLLINNLEGSDEGYYYFTAGDSFPSEAALLYVNRLVAHYPFNGDPNDAVGNANGQAFGNPTYVPGRAFGTQALSLNGSNQYVLLDPAKQYPKAGDPNIPGLERGFTIAAWVKVGSFSSGRSFFGVRNAGTGYPELRFRQRYGDTGECLATGRATASMGGESWLLVPQHPTPWYNDGQWYLVVLRATPGSNGLKGSINTRMRNLANWNMGTGETITPWATGMAIGAYNNQGSISSYFQGVIDEVSIYNYFLTDADIERLFLGPCPDWQYAKYDVDGNCRIDIVDFAAFVEEWLSCGREPQTRCW